MTLFLCYNGIEEAIDLPDDPQEIKQKIPELFGIEYFNVDVPETLSDSMIINVYDFFCCCEIENCTKSIDIAVALGHLDCLRYLYYREKDEDVRKDYWKRWKYEGFTMAAINGHLDCLQFMLETSKCVDYLEEPSLLGAANANQLECLEYLIKNVKQYSVRVIENAVSGGNLESIKLLTQGYKGKDTFNTATINAIIDNKLDIVKHFIEIGTECTATFMEFASEEASFEMVKFLVVSGCPNYRYAVLNAVIRNEQDMLKCLLDNGSPVDISECYNRASNDNNLETVRMVETFLGIKPIKSIFDYKQNEMMKRLKDRFELNRFDLMHAASGGYLECLDYIISKEPRLEYISNYANLECLEYMIGRGFKTTQMTLEFAAKNGKLDCLRFLVERGCQYITNLTRCAAEYGHLDCLIYLIDKGYTVTQDTILAGCKHFECLRFFIEKGYLVPRDVVKYFCDDIDSLRYLFEKGFSFDAINLRMAIVENNFECVKFMVDNGCSFEISLLDAPEIESYGDYSDSDILAFYACENVIVLKYLIENGCPWSDKIIFGALEQNNIECLEFLMKTRAQRRF